jgi:shikimate kinase
LDKNLAVSRLNKPTLANQNLILIGPMGSGKSTVGKRLAARLGKQFVDCDQQLEQHLNVDIGTIFDIEGEQGFRQREHEMLKSLCAMSNVVIATGGGCVLREDNRSLLQAAGVVIYLRITLEHQLNRLSRDKTRPLLQAPDRLQRLQQMATQREPLYTAIADVVVDSGGHSVAKMAAKVHSMLQQKFVGAAASMSKHHD